MAATRLIPLHVNKGKTIAKCLKARVEYAENGDKTEEGLYVTSYMCNPEIADKEFLESKSEYLRITGRKPKGDIIAYQIRQSFKPGEITPEEANAIGYETALRFTKKNHAFIVATHTDKEHIHNHIIFNSTDLCCDRKFKNHFRSSFVLQKISDMVCLENGKSIIEPRREDNKKRFRYDERYPKKKKLDLLIDIEEKLKQGKGQGYAYWGQKHNQKTISKTYMYLREQGITDYEDLKIKAEEASDKFTEITETIKAAEARMAEISELRTQIIDYSKTRDVYTAYQKSGYSKKFYEEHREEITIHKAAKETFSKLKGKVPRVKELNEEFQENLQRKKEAYSQYKEAKERMKGLLDAKYNIDMFLKPEEHENRQKNQNRKRDKHI